MTYWQEFLDHLVPTKYRWQVFLFPSVSKASHPLFRGAYECPITWKAGVERAVFQFGWGFAKSWGTVKSPLLGWSRNDMQAVAHGRISILRDMNSWQGSPVCNGALPGMEGWPGGSGLGMPHFSGLPVVSGQNLCLPAGSKGQVFSLPLWLPPSSVKFLLYHAIPYISVQWVLV